MQYVGLKDKRRVEIYEGDILRFHVGGAGAGTMIGQVEYFDYYFAPKKEFGFSLLNELEIIGNIHENPELLNPPIKKP